MAPYKLSEDMKKKYQKEYIVEGEEVPKEQICRREADVIKAQDRVNIHEDQWAITELRNVTAKLANGKDANLLNAVGDGSFFIVKGEAHVDEEFKNKLMTYRSKAYKNLNGSLIQLQKVDNVSIGWDPVTIWVASTGGWFEVKPAYTYRQMFANLQHVVGLFYLAVDDWEDRAHGGGGVACPVWEDVQTILERYMKVDGSGVTVAELIDACKMCRDYILEQFRKKVTSEYWVAGFREMIWTECNFYRWIVANCPSNPPDILPADPFMAKTVPPATGPRTAASTFKVKRKSPQKSPLPPIRSPTPPPASLSHQPPTYDNINQWPRKVAKDGRLLEAPVATSYHGVYASPEYPQGMQSSYHNVEIITVIACHARHCNRFGELSPENVGNAFYMDYMCDKNQAAHQVLFFYAKAVAAKLAELNPEWKKTRVYKELLEAVHDPSGLGDGEKSVVRRLTVLGEKATHRKWSKRNFQNQAAHSVSASASASPAPGPSSTSNVSRAMGQLKITNAQSQTAPSKKRKSASPPVADLPPEKRHRDASKISTSRTSSPATGKENAKVDSRGKPFPQRIKRSNAF